MKVRGSSVLITGGARGIGRAIVDGFVQDGAFVCVLEKDDSACNILKEDYGSNVAVWKCDVSDPAQVDATLAEASESGYKYEVLVNNAGIIHSEPLINITARGDRVHSRETWKKVISTDLDSVFYVTSRVVEGMVESRTKGVVISISSISANGNPGQSAYSAAKAGVNALTKTWAKELGVFGIRFNAISPGFIETSSTRTALSDQSIARLQQLIPLRKLGTPEAIHHAARSIVENDYINGTIIEVDGGLTI